MTKEDNSEMVIEIIMIKFMVACLEVNSRNAQNMRKVLLSNYCGIIRLRRG